MARGTIAVVVAGMVLQGGIAGAARINAQSSAVEQRPQAPPVLASARSDAGRAQAARAGIDVGAVVDTVRHRRHLASAAAGAAYPLALDPTVSPEHPVADPVYGGAAGDQSRPAVAFDGTNFLVVWDDRRSGPTADVFGARVSRAGAVLDPGGIPIATAAGDQGSPAVAFDGTNFLVVWTDNRSVIGADVFGARVSRAGTVLDPAGIPISTAADDQFNTAVAFDGTNFLVVWTDNRSVIGADVFGARVSRAGTVLDPAGIPISTAANDQQAPALAFDGTNFLVVWTDRRADVTADVFGTRVSRAGTVLDPAGIPVASGAGGQSPDAVAFGGTNFLVVWDDGVGGRNLNADVFGTRVSRTGTVLDPAGIPIATAANGQLDAAVAFDGNNFLVVWQDSRSGSLDIFGARVSPAGTVLDASGIPISTAVDGQGSPELAFDGTNQFVVWPDRRSGGVGSSDVFGARVSRAGTVLDPAGIAISTTANTQSDPAVAYDGTNFMVVWTDARSGADDVFAARVTPSGTVLDAAGIPIATASGDQRDPVIAFDGTNFLVAWTDVRSGTGLDVFAARVSRAGVVLDPAGIHISAAANTQSDPAVAFDGANFLVVWQDFRSGVTFDVFGARVTRTGSVLDPVGIPVSTAANGQFAPAVAYDGTNFSVVWSDTRSGGGDVFGARVTRTGAVLDPAGIPIATGPVAQGNPALAFDGTNLLVVWEVFRSGAALDVVGARVNRAGTVLDPSGIPISATAGDQFSPAVSYDGVNFLVAWADSRPRFGRRGPDIVGARVRTDGTVRDPSGVMIAGARTDEVSPAVAAVPRNGWGVVYQRDAPEAPYAANRVFLRTVSRR